MNRAVLLPLFFLSLFVQAKEREVYDESIESERSFGLFGGPTREGPEAEWALAQEDVQKGRLKRAIQHAENLVQAWPDHPLAVDAQRLQGDLLFAREEYQEAFQAYQDLIDGFAGEFDYQSVLRQQLEAARKLENKVYKAFFGLSTYQNPSQAVPLYRQLLTNAPRMNEAPQILFDIGEIYQREGDYLSAIQEYRILDQRYPRHPISQQAVLSMADAYLAISKRNPTDVRPLEGALETLTYYQVRFPESANLPDVRLRQKDAYDRLAGIRFEQARFYEENLKRPQAALVSYRSLVEQFPDSEWTVPARERILSISDKEL
jgi:outer membrane protein assembly factor BamD (BamD/ComL family)